MEAGKMFRIVLALAVGAGGAALYASNAVAHPACPITSGGANPTWANSVACCTQGNNACSWGETDGFGDQWMKATADGRAISACGGNTRWRAVGQTSGGGVACSLDSALNGTYPGIGNTASTPCNGAIKTKINYIHDC
jgi:hypothetical protein